MRTQSWLHLLRLTLLPVGDTILFNIALWIGYGLLILLGRQPAAMTYSDVAWFAWTLPPLAFLLAGLYREWRPHAFVQGAGAIFSGVTGTVVLLAAATWIARGRILAFHIGDAQPAAIDVKSLAWGIPTGALVISLLAATGLLWVFRVCMNGLERRLFGWSRRPRRAVSVGPLKAGDLDRLKACRTPPYEIFGYFSHEPIRGERPADCLGPLESMEAFLKEREVEEVFLVAPALDRANLLQALSACFAAGVRPRLVPGVQEALVSAATPRLRGGMPFYQIRNAGISGWALVAKRLLDVAAAAAGLLVAIPVFLLPACIAIVIDSKGWPVFAQTRVGLHGRHFKLYKLRTMVIDADAKGGPLTVDRDPRITRVGHFLRRTSIDELPQLWNVLKGDISLVGPRAVVPYVADRFEEWERLSLTVRPGVTGLAQISGRDEIGFREKSLFNLYYVRNHSFWLDLRIIFDTVWTVLSMEGTGGTQGAK